MTATQRDDSVLARPRATPVKRSTTSREIVDFVRGQILTGGLPAGERINQDALAEEFGVSRLPVREAMIALESEGLVRSELHRGVYVIPITRADIEDHYTMYGFAQSIAALRAAEELTADQFTELERINDELAQATDSARIRDLDWQFHSIITRVGGSNRLIRNLRQLGRSLPQSLYGMPPAGSKRAVTEHKSIVRALRAGDGPLAGERLQRHTNREGAYLVGLLEKEGVLLEGPSET